MTTDTTPAEAPLTTDDVLVDVRGIKVHFPITKGIIFDKVVGHVYAVDGVDLQIRRGETYGLVGESGCGKSTLGRAILHLEPPTDGTVTFDGESIPRLDQKGQTLSAIGGLPPNLTRIPSGCAFHPRCVMAQDICSTQRPELLDVGPQRQSACHFSEEVLDV